MTDPSDILTRAADRLDEMAGKATSGPWRPNSETDDRKTGLGCDIGGAIKEVGGKRSGAFVARTWGWGPVVENAAYIAAMDPRVGKAVAAWLRYVAAMLEVGSAGMLGTQLDHALAVARLINGPEPAQEGAERPVDATGACPRRPRGPVGAQKGAEDSWPGHDR